jgi:hypothetical protein
MTKKELGKAQKSKKSSNQGKGSKLAQQLKINTPPKINPLSTLNANSPP